jgi:hypothetical protein
VFEHLGLSVIVAAALLWCLVYAVWQTHSEKASGPVVVWREASEHGWSQWIDLDEVAASAGYDAMLEEVRVRASADAAAVQFAVVAHPDDAPDYTLRVLFMSAVRERSTRRLATGNG